MNIIQCYTPGNNISGDGKGRFCERLHSIIENCSWRDLTNPVRNLNIKVLMGNTGYENIVWRQSVIVTYFVIKPNHFNFMGNYSAGVLIIKWSQFKHYWKPGSTWHLFHHSAWLLIERSWLAKSKYIWSRKVDITASDDRFTISEVEWGQICTVYDDSEVLMVKCTYKTWRTRVWSLTGSWIHTADTRI